MQHICFTLQLVVNGVIQYDFPTISSAVSTINHFILRLVRRFLVFVLVWSLSSLDTSPRSDGLGRHAGVVPSTDRLGDLGCMASPLKILLSHSLLYPIHLVLISLSVSHGSLFSLLQGSLKGLIR